MPEPENTEPVHRSGEQASGGSKEHVVRYVLVISLALVILVLSATWITGAFNAPENPSGSTTVSKGEVDNP